MYIPPFNSVQAHCHFSLDILGRQVWCAVSVQWTLRAAVNGMDTCSSDVCCMQLTNALSLCCASDGTIPHLVCITATTRHSTSTFDAAQLQCLGAQACACGRDVQHYNASHRAGFGHVLYICPPHKLQATHSDRGRAFWRLHYDVLCKAALASLSVTRDMLHTQGSSGNIKPTLATHASQQ